MKKTVFVALGGALGTLFRCALYQIPLPLGAFAHPAMTLAINVTGSFLLGLLTILFVRKLRVPASLRLFVTAGVVGGYTTFSTMSKDAVTLLRNGRVLPAAAYLAVSVLLGLAATWGGVCAGKRLERGRGA